VSFWKVQYRTITEEKEVVVEAIDKDTQYVEKILKEVHPEWQEMDIEPVEKPEWIKHSMEDWSTNSSRV
tara:strand:- start:105 stop:311 length:207 start_codon:yes stop_codon:yes gene_type:complete